tara:strand:- start:71 stop:601 length:531 start_codon:yes stop_codon:yes gene_type:complete
MSKLYNAAKKAFFEPAKKAITKIAQKTSGQGPTRGQTINYVKPKLTNLEGEKKKAVLKAKSDVQKSFGPVNEKLRNQAVDMRQTLQKIRKEPITKSGISKGKDVTPGIYESAAKGRKKFKSGGGTELGMQSVKYGLDNDPSITKADPKAKFIAKNKSKKNMKKVAKTPMAKAVRKA